MIYSFLLLALLPMVFMPDGNSDDGEPDDDQQDIPDSAPISGDALSSVLDHATGDPLDPVIEDDEQDSDHDSDVDAVDPVVEDDSDDPDAPLPPRIEDDVAVDLPNTGGGEALPPIIEDDLGNNVLPGPDPGDIQPPVIEDDVATESGDGDILEPVSEDDTASQVGADETVSATAALPAEIEDFDVKSDVLRVKMAPDPAGKPMQVTTQISENGQDTLVYVGAKLIAKLSSTPGFNAAHVHIDWEGGPPG